MREIRTSGSEGGGIEFNRFSLPLSLFRPFGADADHSGGGRYGLLAPGIRQIPAQAAEDEVRRALRKLLHDWGGVGRRARPDERVATVTDSVTVGSSLDGKSPRSREH